MVRADPTTSRARGRTRRAVITLLSQGPRSRAEIARELGVSPTTVSNLVNELLESGSAVERAATDGRRGRPARTVSLVPAPGLVAGVDIGRTHLRAALATRGGEILDEREVALPAGHTGQQTVPVVLELIGDLLREAPDAAGELVAVGVGLPGPVDGPERTIGPGTILTGWAGFDVAGRLEDALGVPVVADNDATLGMLAEARWGAAQGTTDAAYVKISTGVGAGLLLGGRLHRGAGGTAGELGHTPLQPDGVVCRCGNRGCLETVTSVPAVLQMLRPTLGEGLTIEQVVAAAAAGDPPCRRMIEDVGRNLGRGVALLGNLVDPEVVVLGGPLVAAGEPFLAAVSASLRRSVIPSVARRLRVVPAALGPRTEVLGALALALESAPTPYGYLLD